MNTTATYSSEHSWSRRCSTESVFSIQGKETDFVRDTSDTDCEELDDPNVEFEPVTESEEEGPVDDDTSAASENEIISTRVIAVSVGDDGDLQFADSEPDTYESDSDFDLHDYWRCAQCNATNENSLYRYCEKCFQVRKNFFPPRPKRKRKHGDDVGSSQDTIGHSQDTIGHSQDTIGHSQDTIGHSRDTPDIVSPDTVAGTDDVASVHSADIVSVHSADIVSVHSADIVSVLSADSGVGSSDFGSQDSYRPPAKKHRRRSFSDSDGERSPVQPLAKTVSDPAISIDAAFTKKEIAITLRERIERDLCVVCAAEPKSGVFVHGRVAHICCCYKCAVKVWARNKRCPVCNCKVSNVLRAVVM